MVGKLSNLTIEKSVRQPDVQVFKLSGRLTAGPDIGLLESRVEDLVGGNVNKVVFDMAELAYVDSAGLGAIVSCTTKLKQAGGQLRLAAVTERVKALFKMTGTDAVLNVDPTQESAALGLGASA